MELALTFIIITTLIVAFAIWILKLSSKQGSTLSIDWRTFKEACEENQIQNVVQIGIKLCGNFHLTKEQLDQISAFTEKNIAAYPELESLRIAVKDKIFKWNRRIYTYADQKRDAS